MSLLRRLLTRKRPVSKSQSLEEALDDFFEDREPTTGRPKASTDKISRLISILALGLSAVAFYYSSLRQVDDLKMFSDGRVYAVVSKNNSISAEIPDVLYFSNGGTRPVAITYVNPNITFECPAGKRLAIGTPLSASVVSIEPGKIVAVKVSPAKFDSELEKCQLQSITVAYTIDSVNAAGSTQRVSIPWRRVGDIPNEMGVVFAFKLDGPVKIFHLGDFGLDVLWWVLNK